MANKLFVANLPWSVTDDQLGRFFEAAGTVKSAQVVLDRDTGRSRGFGFVEMESPQEAAHAIERLNGKRLEGREILVREAKPENKTSRSRLQADPQLLDKLADFIESAKAGDTFEFSYGKKHFLVSRDDQEGVRY